MHLRGPVPMGMVHLACHCSKNLSTDICILERLLERHLTVRKEEEGRRTIGQ